LTGAFERKSKGGSGAGAIPALRPHFDDGVVVVSGSDGDSAKGGWHGSEIEGVLLGGFDALQG